VNKLIVAMVSLGFSFSGVAGIATAQEKDIQGIVTNADGSYVTSTTGINPTANGEGGAIIYGDINTGPGGTIIGPPTVIQNGTSADPVVVNSPAPAPAPETVTESTAPEPVVADIAVATDTDLDADNYADAGEPELGLDPNNADTDGDDTADGDELKLYGTEPTVFDTDGDGISDGEELFGILTDPLTWNDFTTESGEAAVQESAVGAAESAPAAEASVAPQALAQAPETAENVTARDGNADAMGPGSASAAPGAVTRGVPPGMALLGLDGTYSVTDVAPPNVTVAGDTEVLTPAAAPVSTSSVAGCDSYGSWYDAQVAYEATGLTTGDPAIVSALDPDFDGIACEEVM